MKKHSQSGFTLIEMMIVLTIAGLIMGGIMKVIRPYVAAAQRAASIKTMNTVADSVALYYRVHGYIPCPGRANPSTEPFGAASNMNASGDTPTSPTCGEFNGIVPFKTLGLDERYAYDGYNNLITYAVGPVFSGDEIVGAAVHEQCRTPMWRDPDSGLNKNPRKAYLCCPTYYDFATDIMVYEDAAYMHPVFNGQHTPSIPRYSDVNDFLASGVEPDHNSRVIAFVLLSHGDNGDGAFQPRSNDTNPITTHMSSPDRRNASHSFAFFTTPRNMNDGPDYFDDIVIWRTNDQVISAFGDDSCAKP